MRAISLIILLLIFSALGYIYRDTITGWFTGSTPTQTVVLRQTATASPTAAMTPVASTPASITVLPASPTATPVPSNLPTTGPADSLVPVLGFAALGLMLWRWVGRPTVSPKRPLDIL